MRTAMTELLGVDYPIVGFNRSPGVVAAVTNAGGFGVLAASAYRPEELDAQLTWIEEQVQGKPYGVDLLVPEKFAAGDPNDLIASLRAQIPAQHFAFVRDLLERYDIPPAPEGTASFDEIAGNRPVLAAGGIASGRQMAAALALGAAGVWCGSVWLSSEEDVANQAIKNKFLAATSSDTVRSPTRTGKPARQLRSSWHDEWETAGAPEPLLMPLQPLLVNEAWQRIDAAAQAGHEGALKLESFFVGQVVGSFREVRPAAEIVRQMVADCERRLTALAALLPTLPR